jgi:mono/diheme cytochrome c family protein
MAQGHSMTVKSIVTNIVCVVVVAPILAAVIVWGCWVLIPEPPPPPASIEPTASQTDNASSAHIRPAPHTLVSGRTVYMANCARCHGASGDGQGTEKLDRPARSFLEGGFSFGNTTEAVRRVVQHGIAGTPMPGFIKTLNGSQTKAVVKYVLSLSPPSPPPSTDAELVVGNRPMAVRGMLPPHGPGDAPEPRGLLIGGTDGLTLAYNTNDVSFRAARQGKFVRRTDWEGRGGTALEPLGRVIHRAGPWPTFFIGDDPISAKFLGTSIRDDRVSLRMAIDGASITEYGKTTTYHDIPGYVRILDIDGNANGLSMSLPAGSSLAVLGTADGWSWWRSGPDVIGVRGGRSGIDRFTLPASGSVEIMVLPGLDAERAAAVGIPLDRQDRQRVMPS